MSNNYLIVYLLLYVMFQFQKEADFYSKKKNGFLFASFFLRVLLSVSVKRFCVVLLITQILYIFEWTLTLEEEKTNTLKYNKQ